MSLGRRSAALRFALLLVFAVGARAEDHDSPAPRSIRDGDDLVSAVLSDCLLGDATSPMTCLRLKVLSYLDVAVGAKQARASDEVDDARKLDEMILSRVQRYLRSHEFKLQLPEFLFQEAVLTFRPSRGLADFRVDFPAQDPNEDRALSAARGMLKKKLLLPVLLLLKLKMKALTPLLLALVGMKALKALVLSKIAILLVVGFLVSQMLKKVGMQMPMPMAMPMHMPMPMMPGDQYGAPPSPAATPPPAPAMGYGAPSSGGSVTSQPSSSYELSWDSGASSGPGGPYSRVWDAHQAAYSAYSPQAGGQPASQQARRR